MPGFYHKTLTGHTSRDALQGVVIKNLNSLCSREKKILCIRDFTGKKKLLFNFRFFFVPRENRALKTWRIVGCFDKECVQMT